MCMPICLDVERPLDLWWWDWTRNFPRRHSHLEQERSGDRILGWAAAPWLKKKIGRTATIWSGKKVRRNKFKQRKSLAGDRRDAVDVASSRSRKCAARADRKIAWPRVHVRGHATVLHGKNSEGLGTCTHHVERRRKSSFERPRPSLFWKKITPGMSNSFETWQEYFWTINASFNCKKED